MNQNKTEEPPKKRTWIARAALESALAENVRGSDPQCEGLIEIIVERVVPASPDGANWAVKGVKYGKAERKYAALRYPRLWKKVSASSKFRTGPRRWWSAPMARCGVSPT